VSWAGLGWFERIRSDKLLSCQSLNRRANSAKSRMVPFNESCRVSKIGVGFGNSGV